MRAPPLTVWHSVNLVGQLAFDACVARVGAATAGFCLLCVLVAGGLHPCAGHFVAEHYVFPHKSPTQETYSYYGALNRVTWNVGYHTEHHDFPSVSWYNFPLTRDGARVLR